MSVDYKTFIALACEQAYAGSDPNASPLQDIEMVAESLVPKIFQDVALAAAADPDKQSLLRRTHTVVMSSGVGTLPDEALTQCLTGASIADPSDVTVAQTQTLVPFFQDFIQPRDNIQSQLNYWTVNDDVITYLAPQEDYPGSFSGDLQITIASVPAIPASETDTLVVPDEILSDLISALALALKGQIVKS